MTQSFQQRVIDAIERRLHDYGLDTSIQAHWGNTGTIYGHLKGEIEPAIQVGYNFQHGSYNLTLTVGDIRIPSQVGRYDYFDFYHDPVTARTRFWGCLDDELAEIGEPVANKYKAAGGR